MPDNAWETSVYQAGRQINRWPYSELVSRISRSQGFGRRDKTRVLELGCGTGNNLRFLAEEGFIAFGIDGSPTAIEKTRELLNAHNLHASVQVGDIAALPWPDNRFDLVVDRAALVHNTPSCIRLALQEAFRTLRPGGKIISIGLKSTAHPDLVFGVRQESGAWSQFSRGKFQGLGETSFFSPEEAQQLFSDFDSVAIEILTRSNQYGEILDQEFIIEAIKP